MKFDDMLCNTPMRHADKSVAYCTLPKEHFVQIEDSEHIDEHGHSANVLVRQSTIREVARVGREYPDGIHTCAELQRLEPGRRPCTCGRCEHVDCVHYQLIGGQAVEVEKLDWFDYCTSDSLDAP